MYYIGGQQFHNLDEIVDSGLSIVPISTLKHRIYKKGWNILDAISTPAGHSPKALELRIVELASYGKYSHKQIADICGTNPKKVENTLTNLKYKY